MSRSKPGDGGPGPENRVRADSPASEEERVFGPLEAFFSELIRRGTALGLSSLVLTEEAIRRAFSDKVPPEWVGYASRQGDELRRELVDRLGKEFGQWLRTQDPAELLQQMLDRYDVSARIELRPADEPRGDRDATPGASLRVVTKRR